MTLNAESVRRFMVKRTSVWDEKKQPCPEAYRATYTHIDQRTAKTHEAMTKIDGLLEEQDVLANFRQRGGE